MSVWAVIGSVITIAWALYQALRGDAAVKAAAQKALWDQFALLEAQGQPVLRDILVEQGRTTFQDWNSIPALATLPASSTAPVGTASPGSLAGIVVPVSPAGNTITVNPYINGGT